MKMNNGLFLFVAIFLVFGVVLWANPPGGGNAPKPAVAAAPAASAPAAPAATATPVAAPAKPAEVAKPAPAKSAEPAKAAAAPVAVAGLEASVIGSTGEKDYNKGRWHPIHFRPAIDSATNEQCLSCHQEVLKDKVREETPAGLKAADTLAWYQTLDTYKGPQDTFHQRHLTSPLAVELMDLKCNFCHRGNDPRDEMVVPPTATNVDAGHTLRKVVDVEQTCLLCHGRFPNENMEGVSGPWTEAKADLESDDQPNGCMSCHAKEGGFRPNRHKVSYLKADKIEESAAKNADTCYGCHGGRSWYRISYPYPRHAWDGMPDPAPEWAKGRPTASDPRYALPAAK